MSTITITDDFAGGPSITVDSSDVAEVLIGWFPDAPIDIAAAVESLGTAIRRGEWEKVNDLAVYLAIKVTR